MRPDSSKGSFELRVEDYSWNLGDAMGACRQGEENTEQMSLS